MNKLITVFTLGMAKSNFFKDLVKPGSDVSSKSFFLVCTTLIGMLLLLVPAIILCVEVWYNHTITTDLSGLAQYIAAVASVFATAGLTKAWADRGKTHNNQKDTIEINNEPEEDNYGEDNYNEE